jgi:hypothetical protein
MNVEWPRAVCLCVLFAFSCGSAYAAASTSASEPNVISRSHPRLYFTADELVRLRSLRTKGPHALIWKNLSESADWCLTQPLRETWIAPKTPDPIYLNLYDRFYAMMHDMAVMEHLSFAYAYSGDHRYLEGARRWTLACCRVWGHESDGQPDASKAYAVMRLLKGVSTSYDMIYGDLTIAERNEIRHTLRDIGHKYYQWYLDNPGMAGPGQGFHHGSVEAASFGITALALLGEVPEAQDWLNLMVKKHTEFLLPHGTTPSGSQSEGAGFWSSTMQYRLAFMDALRRVTGRDLFGEFKGPMDGKLALAVLACPMQPGWNESHQSVMFHPSYEQLNYYTPVMLYLAKEYRKPIYQYLAFWDPTIGAIQKTRFITPNGEALLFEWGGLSYAWYDPTVRPKVEPGLPLSFVFPETGHACVRSSYEPNGLMAGSLCGVMEAFAGGRPVLIEEPPAKWPAPGKTLSVEDKDGVAMIRCGASDDLGFSDQTISLNRRASTITVRRATSKPLRWYCHGKPSRKGNSLVWDGGARINVTKGTIVSVTPDGYNEELIVGMGLLKCIDPHPMKYPMIEVAPIGGQIELEVRTH